MQHPGQPIKLACNPNKETSFLSPQTAFASVSNKPEESSSDTCKLASNSRMMKFRTSILMIKKEKPGSHGFDHSGPLSEDWTLESLVQVSNSRLTSIARLEYSYDVSIVEISSRN